MAAKHPERCPTCGRRNKRSNEQNSRYWALLSLIAERLKPKGESYSTETWHTLFKKLYIGWDEVKLPNGQPFIVVHSSADLDVAAFGDYMTQIEAFAAEYDVYLDDLETLR